MSSFRVVMIVLAVVHAVAVGFVAFAGSFADGGLWWQYAAVIVMQPVGAITLLVVVLNPSPGMAVLRIGSAMLNIHNILEIIIAAMILFGVTDGDWWLPLVFTVIPSLGIMYARLLQQRQRS